MRRGDVRVGGAAWLANGPTIEVSRSAAAVERQIRVGEKFCKRAGTAAVSLSGGEGDFVTDSCGVLRTVPSCFGRILDDLPRFLAGLKASLWSLRVVFVVSVW